MEREASSPRSQPQSRWSALPADILTTVFRRLNSHFHLLRLRAVCSSWRSSLPLSLSPPSPFPLLVPTPTSSVFVFHPSPPSHLAVFRSTLIRLSPLSSPSRSWLLKLLFSNTPNSFSLLNPLTTTKIKTLPSPNPINLLDFRISEIADSFHLKAEESPVLVRKVVVLPDLTVMLLSYGGRLEKWRFGDQNWTPISGKNNDKRDCYYHFHDVIWVRNQCYAINVSGILLKFDSDFNAAELTSSLGYSPREQKYLVPSSSGDDLYLVTKISDPDPDFYYDYCEDEYIVDQETIDVPLRMRVFKLNLEQGYWDFVGRTGEEVFFLGDDVSFMVSAKDFEGCRANSIYLTDECFCQDDDDEEDNVYGQDTGLYALDECFVERLADSREYAKLFWPPPHWLMQDSNSSGI